MKKYIILLILYGLILSCKHEQKVQSIDIVLDINALEEIKITAENYIKNATYIQLETNDDCLIGNYIEKLVDIDNKIFILDSNNKIFVFDANGAFLNTIGEKGGGPDELLSIMSFYVHPIKEYVGVIDVLKHTVFKYSYNGVLLDKVKYDNSLSEFYEVDLVNDENQLILTTFNEQKNNYEYLIVDENNMKLERDFSPYIITAEVPMKYGFPRVSILKDTCFILTQYSDIVQKYHDGKVNPYLLLDTHLKGVAHDTKFSDATETGSILDINNNLEKNKYSLGLEQVFSTNDFLYLNTFNYDKQKIYNIFRDLQRNQNYSVILDEAFLIYPIAGIVSFENFLTSTSNDLVAVFVNREGFMDVDEEVINNNESIKKIRSEYEEDGNPIIVYINLKKLLEDAKK